MKRIFLTALIFLAAGAAFSQQTRPTSAQTKQEAQQFLNQSRTNSQQFQGTLTDLKNRNSSNRDADAFIRLSAEIEQLETSITSEQRNIESRLNSGTKVSSTVLGRVDRMINTHTAKLDELEGFISAD